MRELAERARAAPGLEEFRRSLSDQLASEFDNHIVPLALDPAEAYRKLQRCNFETVGHPRLIRSVEQRIPALIQRSEGTPANPVEVRHVLTDLAWHRLSQTISAGDVLGELKGHGFAEQPVVASAQVRANVNDRNQAYARRIKRTLVNGAYIPREQATTIVKKLTAGGQSLLLAGSAGEGKSCVVAQVLNQLGEARIPHLALSTDELDGIVSSTDLASRMGLPASPAIVLGQMSAGDRAVLCIDQLDALSFVSGRNLQGRAVLEELIEQASRYPELRIFLACRSFDLDHDDMLRGLVSGETPTAHRIDVELLSVEDVRAALATAGLGDLALSESQVELLRTPLHLYLFLEGGRAGNQFDSPRDLFGHYWEEKRRRVDEVKTHGAFTSATERLSAVLSDRRQLQAPRMVLTGHEAALETMASEGVVVLEESRVSFFHASFFDFAFARGFIGSGRDLVDWLKADGQDLFRRSQVRQILEFLRDGDFEVYLSTLRRLLGDQSVRFHLKRAHARLARATH